MDNNIVISAAHAEQLAASFVTNIANLEKQVTERQSKAAADAAKFGRADGQDPDVRRVIAKNAEDTAKREAHAFRRQLLADSEKERTDRLRGIVEIEAQASALAPLYELPAQLLSRQGLGSPERSRYMEQIANAGPAELKSMGDWAIHTGDKNLGAAVLSRLDALPTKMRPFSANDFSMKMVGEEFDATRKAIERARVAAQRALNANRDFERGRVDATAKISMGLAQRAVKS